MSENIDILKDDIAFMRALAQEGRRAPLLGGAALLSAGLIFSVTTLVYWAMAAGPIVAPDIWRLGGVWIAAMIVDLAVMAVLVGRWRRAAKAGGATTANRAFRWAWSACGWAMGAIFAGSALVAWRAHDSMVFAAFPTIILALYGAGWTISAAMSDRRWVRWVAIGSFVASVGIALLPNTNAVCLAYVVALLLLVAAPGAALMREEPSDIV